MERRGGKGEGEEQVSERRKEEEQLGLKSRCERKSGGKREREKRKVRCWGADEVSPEAGMEEEDGGK